MSKLHRSLRIVCLFLLAAAVLVGIGAAFGRYSSTIRDTLFFQAAPKEESRAIAIRTDGGWHTADDNATLTFSLVSGVADQRATLRLTATDGFPSSGTVTLTVDGITYTAVAETVGEGDPLYDKMGGGTEYRFFDGDAERVWPVADGAVYTLTVTGDADVSLLRLTATEA